MNYWKGKVKRVSVLNVAVLQISTEESLTASGIRQQAIQFSQLSFPILYCPISLSCVCRRRFTILKHKVFFSILQACLWEAFRFKSDFDQRFY